MDWESPAWREAKAEREHEARAEESYEERVAREEREERERQEAYYARAQRDYDNAYYYDEP